MKQSYLQLGVWGCCEPPPACWFFPYEGTGDGTPFPNQLKNGQSPHQKSISPLSESPHDFSPPYKSLSLPLISQKMANPFIKSQSVPRLSPPTQQNFSLIKVLAPPIVN